MGGEKNKEVYFVYKIYRFGFALFLFCVGFALFVQKANAASLNLSPSSGSYANGDVISVGVYVSSPDRAMNAASGVISFPTDKLQIVSLNKSGTIFSLWVQEPSYSNAAGTVNFEGITLNPGFKGTSGKMLTVVFKTKTTGSASLSFSSGSVLANDGNGTEILDGLGGASFAINEPATGQQSSESTTPVEKVGVPLAPKISSPTHPNPDSWFSNASPRFEWVLPATVTSARLLINNKSNSSPTVSYTPPISSKEVGKTDDGIWYLHIQLKNSYGWGEISHFRFQIDTAPPDPFKITLQDGPKTENPQPKISFGASDSLSGIEYYQVKVGPEEYTKVPPSDLEQGFYILPIQKPGRKNIIVQALDKAGNQSTAVTEITILPVEAPIITDYPKQILSEEAIIIKGNVSPDADVTIFLQRENDKITTQSIKSDSLGNFTFIAGERSKDGVYKVWAQAIAANGATSELSEKATVIVKRPPFLVVGSAIIDILAVVIPVVSLFILLGLLVWYSWQKFVKLKMHVKKETKEAQSALSQAFSVLKEHFEDQIILLDKAKTSKDIVEVNKIITQLKRDFDTAERYVSQEIGDIEKKVK